MRSRMSIIPKLVSQMWEQMERPHRLFDQHFGLGLHPESFFNSPSLFERRLPAYSYANMRQWADLMREAENGWSMIKDDKNKFHVALDVQQFKPEEINVKVVDNYIVVEGKISAEFFSYCYSNGFDKRPMNLRKRFHTLLHDAAAYVTRCIEF
uniref:SHSP domain-containing protein n=1 Tax=Anisopteromalus calandrae TaxID=76800 RepID=A0AAU7BB07_9HYME